MTAEWWKPVEKALQSGDWKHALTHLRKSGEREDHRYWKLLCCIYLQAGRWHEAATFSASAAQRFPLEPIFWECWAWAEHKLGDTPTALRILENVSRSFSQRESFVYTLACLYASLNRRSEAERSLATALRLSTDPAAFAVKVSRQRELRILWRADEMMFAA